MKRNTTRSSSSRLGTPSVIRKNEPPSPLLNHRQGCDRDNSLRAAKHDDGTAILLLLRYAVDGVVAGIVVNYFASLSDSEAMAARKVSIGKIVLTAAGSGSAQPIRPPAP